MAGLVPYGLVGGVMTRCISEFVPEEFDCEDVCFHCGKDLATEEPPTEEAFKVWNGGFCSAACETAQTREENHGKD